MSMEIVSTFQERFSEAIEGMSLSAFAKKINVSKQTTSAYRRGKRKPKQPMMHIIAQALGVNPFWLAGYNVPKEVNIIQAKGSGTISIIGTATATVIPMYFELDGIWNKLNDKGQSSLVEYARFLLTNNENKKENSDIDLPR